MKRRLMTSVVRMTRARGVLEARSCAEATIEAPAKTTIDMSIATSGGMPLATMATPVMMPKGITASSTGSVARAPAVKLLFTSMLLEAGAQLVALLVLAGCARLLALLRRLLDLRLALCRVLGLCAQLAAHARAILGILALHCLGRTRAAPRPPCPRMPSLPFRARPSAPGGARPCRRSARAARRSPPA